MEFVLLALAILAIAARPSDPRVTGAALNEDDDLVMSRVVADAELAAGTVTSLDSAIAEFDEDDDLRVHRCWNCWKAIPVSATRCKHCGVSQ